LSTLHTGAKALAVLAATTLVLSACAADEDEPSDQATSASTAPITFTWAYEQEFSAYNQTTPDGNQLANAVVLNQVLRGFFYYSPDGSVAPDTDFGKFEKTSDDPLTVEYTFNDKAAWSDGEPIDCDDFVLTWLARGGKSQDAEGKGGFLTAAATGYEDQNKPQCADGDKKVVLTYAKPFADWASLYGSNEILPAHILEKESGVTDIIAAADNPKDPALNAAYKFWNTAWNLEPGTLKPDISPSAGPYTISAWQAGQSLTLKANPKWWGAPPKAETIVIRYIGGNQQVQALQNGEINAMDPQPQVELINQLKAAGDKVKYSTADQFSYEQFTLNFATVFKDPKVREAFAKCVPRQQIVDNLIVPINPTAKIQQSRYMFPFQAPYADFQATVGGDKYNTVDIAGAKALLEEANAVGTTVRVGWKKDPDAINQRRVDTLALTKDSCEKAGFKIKDTGTKTFFDVELPGSDFDAAMFAWSGSAVVTGQNAIFKTNGGNNFGKYSNKELDTVLDNLATEVNPDAQLPIVKQIDQILWKDLAQIPIFAFPGVVATTPDAEGVVYNASQAELTWNAYAWSLKQ
jgi:peptide/nickel transport system substrate-binding protein